MQRGFECVIEVQAIPGEISLESHSIPVAASGWMGRHDTAILNAAAATAKETGEHVQPNIPTTSFHNLDDERSRIHAFELSKLTPLGALFLNFARLNFLTLRHPQQREGGPLDPVGLLQKAWI
jgi:hypothetical protein